jgi:hypothetical protein
LFQIKKRPLASFLNKNILFIAVAVKDYSTHIVYEVDVVVKMLFFLLQEFEGCNVFLVKLEVEHHFIGFFGEVFGKIVDSDVGNDGTN